MKNSKMKSIGIIILAIGIATLITGVVLFILSSVTAGFWTIIGSILVNVIGISMITKKNN